MPQRLQRKRTKGWKAPEGAVYVGRPSMWGNPYVVGSWTRTASGLPIQVKDAAMAVCLFATDIREAGSMFSDDVRRELRGKDLLCWCALDQPCHADVLLEIANS